MLFVDLSAFHEVFGHDDLHFPDSPLQLAVSHENLEDEQISGSERGSS